MRKKSVYQLFHDENAKAADLYVYGDITSRAEILNKWYEGAGYVSAKTIVNALAGLDVDDINVYINSYGGEVAEALAIHSALKRNKAQVHTFNDGFACSAATIIFCAGDTRTMGKLALMMIHNCMSFAGYANSEELRKVADDNDKINSRSIEAYLSVSSLTEGEIKNMMDKEAWLSAEECLKLGFATEIAEDDEEDEDEGQQQSALQSIHDRILGTYSAELEQVATPLEDFRAVMREELASFADGLRKKPEGKAEPQQSRAKARAHSLFAALTK